VTLAATKNQYAVHSSKAVGEPPFFMGCSTFFAIKEHTSLSVYLYQP